MNKIKLYFFFKKNKEKTIMIQTIPLDDIRFLVLMAATGSLIFIGISSKLNDNIVTLLNSLLTKSDHSNGQMSNL